MRILTSGQMARERANDKGMAFIRLMENATACANCKDRLRNEQRRKAVIVCGAARPR